MQGWVIIPVVAIIASMIAGIFKSIAQAKIAAGGDGGPMRARIEALEQELNTVRGEVGELQERVDFTERMLAKTKDAGKLGS